MTSPSALSGPIRILSHPIHPGPAVDNRPALFVILSLFPAPASRERLDQNQLVSISGRPLRHERTHADERPPRLSPGHPATRPFRRHRRSRLRRVPARFRRKLALGRAAPAWRALRPRHVLQLPRLRRPGPRTLPQNSVSLQGAQRVLPENFLLLKLERLHRILA